MQQPAIQPATSATVPVEVFLSQCCNFAREKRLDDAILQALQRPGLWQLEPPACESLNSLFRRFAETWRVCEHARELPRGSR